MEIFLKQAIAASLVFPLLSKGTVTRKSGATLSSGDFKIIRHTGGTWVIGNPTTPTPTEISTTGFYELPLTATELTPDDQKYPIIVTCHDVSDDEWDDQSMIIRVFSNDIDDLDTTTIANRIGAFTGSGTNTMLGFFRAFLRKDASLTPTDVGGTYNNTTDSLEAIKDTGTNVTVTLTPAQISEYAASQANVEMVINKFYDYYKLFTDLTITSGWEKIYFTIKSSKNLADTAATLQLVATNYDSPSDPAYDTDGVIRLNGAAVSETVRLQGILTADQPNQEIELSLEDELTSVMNKPTSGSWYFDIKEINSAGSVLVKEGLIVIRDGVTRTTI